jgi:hypothetical protein
MMPVNSKNNVAVFMRILSSGYAEGFASACDFSRQSSGTLAHASRSEA